LWRSAGAVVLGKNQNPWREVNLPVLRAEGLALARRCSGGGTVFHDAGNLNYALALSRDDYDQDKIFDQLVRAFHAVDIPAARGPHHSLLVHGQKFSGSAFCFRRRAALHHGTLLVHADLACLQRVLTGGLPIASRAVASHPMPVINLSEVKTGFDLDAAAQVVINAFASHAQPLNVDELDLDDRVGRQRSWDWQFGQTPPFEFDLEGVTVRLEHGRVVAPPAAALTAAQHAHLAELFQGLENPD
jgi:lipoate-protein ligase A